MTAAHTNVGNHRDEPTKVLVQRNSLGIEDIRRRVRRQARELGVLARRLDRLDREINQHFASRHSTLTR